MGLSAFEGVAITFESLSAVSFENWAISRPLLIAASIPIIAWAPEKVTSAMRFPFGTGIHSNPMRLATRSSMLSIRKTPAWRIAPSKTESSTARLAVCDAVARAPRLVRPPLSMRTGFFAAAAFAVSRNFLPSRTSSRYIPIVRVCSSCVKYSKTSDSSTSTLFFQTDAFRDTQPVRKNPDT